MKNIYVIDKDTNTLHKVSYNSEKVKETIGEKVDRIFNPRPITYVIKRIQ